MMKKNDNHLQYRQIYKMPKKKFYINDVQDLNEENYKILLDNIKEDLSKCGYIPCSWIVGLGILMMSIVLKLV